MSLKSFVSVNMILSIREDTNHRAPACQYANQKKMPLNLLNQSYNY